MPDDSELAACRLQGLDRIAKVVGIAATAAGSSPIASIAGVVGAVVNEATRRIHDRQRGRTERIIDSLVIRLGSVEQDLSDQPPIDLFTEYLRKAVNDENEEKIELHSAFLSWVLTREPEVGIARVLGDAVCALSPPELAAFVRWVRTQEGPRDVLPAWINENMFWNRVEATGLFGGGGVKSAANLTRLGRDLEAICPQVLGSLDCGPPTGAEPSHSR